MKRRIISRIKQPIPRLLLLCLFTFFTISLDAVLPPFYQSLAEINAILTDEQIKQKLTSGEDLLKIEKNENGYEITTNQHKLQVHIIYDKARGPGPRHFKLFFDDPMQQTNR